MSLCGQYGDSTPKIKTPILKIWNVPNKYWFDAVRISKAFLNEYPERTGARQCVVYVSGDLSISFLVYRTKTSVVVRGNGS